MDSISAIVKLVASVVILAAALIRILPKAQDSDNTLRPRCPRVHVLEPFKKTA